MADILIVDDDPLLGNLSSELLQQAGHTTKVLQDSARALESILAERPKLVVVDIMMPGLDGMSLCHQLRSRPETRDLPIVIVSGKTFYEEKRRAQKYGVALYLPKPYDVDTFARRVGRVLGAQVGPPQPAQPPSTLQMPTVGLRFQVWGCRSLPENGTLEGSRFGANSPCVTLATPNHLFIFDGGTGLVRLGEEVVKQGGPKLLWLFLTHFHKAHTQGLASFGCARSPGYVLHVAGANDPARDLQSRLREVFTSGAGASQAPLSAKVELFEVEEDAYEILPNVRLGSIYTNHPSTTLAFSLELSGRRFAYCPDGEILGEEGTALQDSDEKLARFCRGADLLVLNARFDDLDYESQRNSGHTSWPKAVEFAAGCEAKRLLLFHQDGCYSDTHLEDMEERAKRLAQDRGYSLEVGFAKEGLTVDL